MYRMTAVLFLDWPSKVVLIESKTFYTVYHNKKMLASTIIIVHFCRSTTTARPYILSPAATCVLSHRNLEIIHAYLKTIRSTFSVKRVKRMKQSNYRNGENRPMVGVPKNQR